MMPGNNFENAQRTRKADSGRDLNPSFLDSEFPPSRPERAAFHVIPAPLECSVSYGGGTSKGPSAILHASRELEAVLDDRGLSPGQQGLYTAPPLDCRSGVDAALGHIADAVGKALRAGAVPALLGGEHTVTLGAARAIRTHCPQPVGFLQFDAHADLRADYQDNPLSHACVMRRVFELDFPIFQVGIRSRCAQEIAFRRTAGIGAHDAECLADPRRPPFTLPPGFPETLYITFDLDAFDPSVMPATGTPEPGGLHWHAVMDLLWGLSRGRRIIGFDVVELAPIPGLPYADYTAAKLVHVLMGISSASRA